MAWGKRGRARGRSGRKDALRTFAESGGDHTIQKGETLSALAQKFGTTVQELARANNIRNPNMIRAGTKLRVKRGQPGRAQAPTRRPAPAVPQRNQSERLQRLAAAMRANGDEVDEDFFTTGPKGANVLEAKDRRLPQSRWGRDEAFWRKYKDY